MMWTTSPSFRTDRNMTDRRQKLVDYLEEMKEHYGIDGTRIRWVPKTSKRTNMVSEAAYLVREFFAHYGVPENCVIFSDGGNSFKEKEVDIFPSLGFAQHYIFPSAIHQFLSPTDNDLHGAAKVPWRHNVEDFSDELSRCLHSGR